MSAMTIPQASGSSNARLSATCKAPSTTTARRTSKPPNSNAPGGTCSASKAGGDFSDGIVSPVADCLDGLDHFGDRRQGKLFEIGGVGHRYVLAGYPQDWSVKPVEGLFRNACGDLGADPRLATAFLDRDKTICFFDRLDDHFNVHRLECAQVD